MTQPTTDIQMPQIKICGLTHPEEAVACARLGAAAIGLVFYPRSPRHLEEGQAAAICARLPKTVQKVGVFVNADAAEILQRVRSCGLTAVQLHGAESPECVADLRQQGVRVIKAIFNSREPYLADHARYAPDAFLTECGGGRLPGGNAEQWAWGRVRDFKISRPVILAGGLDPDNIGRAMQAAHPDALDVSSGVEAAPGRKDLDRVRRFIENATAAARLFEATDNPIRRVF